MCETSFTPWSNDSDFLEVQELFAPNAITGFSRINGETVGIVANQALVLAGVLDIDASDKIARFVRFCDSFNIPLLTLVDIPDTCGLGWTWRRYSPWSQSTVCLQRGETVPKITVILRKAYGGGYIAMCSHHLRGDFVFAWPTAEIAVMTGWRGEYHLPQRNFGGRKSPKQYANSRSRNTRINSPNLSQHPTGYVDAVTAPEETRACIAHALKYYATKKKLARPGNTGIPPFNKESYCERTGKIQRDRAENGAFETRVTRKLEGTSYMKSMIRSSSRQ